MSGQEDYYPKYYTTTNGVGKHTRKQEIRLFSTKATKQIILI